MANDEVTRRGFVRAGAAVGVAVGVGAAAARAAAGEDAAAKDEGKKDEPKKDETGMPYGKIGDLKISRLILGSNPMGGGAHARDLIYVSRLMQAYNTQERLLRLLEQAEAAGINTILQGPTGLVKKHNRTRGGKMRQILPLQLKKEHGAEKIKRMLASLVRRGAAAVYVMGDRGDYLARDKRVDVIATALEVARGMGVLLGVGGHSLLTVVECEKNRIKPDFYVKTFHNDNYWSATPVENREPFCWYDKKGGNSYSGRTSDHGRFHDNIWCLDPRKTIEVMRRVEVPWIAFKVLAAGAIHPKDGFEFAFAGGADFIAVGMFDFQVRKNAAIAKDCVARLKNRDRPWRA